MEKYKGDNCIDKIFDALDNAIISDINTAKDFLTEEDTNYKETVSNQISLVNKLKAKAKFQLAKEKGVTQLQRAKQKAKQLIQNTEDDIKTVVARILSGNQEIAFNANFRKLEELNEEDVFDMLNEAQILKIISELENEE